MRYFAISALALVCAIGGCARQPAASPEPPKPELTAEQARDALLELMRSPDPGELKFFRPDDYANKEIKRDGKSIRWGTIEINLERRTYYYGIQFGKGDGKGLFTYEGTFELQKGRWVALPSRNTSMS